MSLRYSRKGLLSVLRVCRSSKPYKSTMAAVLAGCKLNARQRSAQSDLQAAPERHRGRLSRCFTE